MANGFTEWGYYGVGMGGGPLVSCINSTFRLIPAPGTVAALGLGLLMGSRRTR